MTYGVFFFLNLIAGEQPILFNLKSFFYYYEYS